MQIFNFLLDIPKNEKKVINILLVKSNLVLVEIVKNSSTSELVTHWFNRFSGFTLLSFSKMIYQRIFVPLTFIVREDE